MWGCRFFCMAKKKDQKNQSSTSTHSLFAELDAQFDRAEEYQRKFKDDPYCSWDEKEGLLLGRNKDSITSDTKSRIFDPRLSTIVIERMNRVMAQHATGVVRALDNPKDKLPSLVLDLVMQKYVLPNADSQYDMLTKFKLLDLYSLVYGSYAMLVDYRIDNDYIGPDSWLIPIRHLYPEANSTTIESCNYVFVDTWVSKSWLKKRSTQTWKNINNVIQELDEKSSEKNTLEQSLAERETQVISTGKGGYGLVRLRTRYEKDRWVTYAPEASGLKENCIVRDIKNPQNNNEIPIVVKHAFPLIDRFFGLGDFERGKSLQYATNSLWNLYLDGVKMRIFPPMIYNPNGVVKSSLGYFPGAKWQETQPNSIRNFTTNSSSDNSFQSTFSTLVASILNQAGTTNTAVSDVTDPGMGKTPQALSMIAAREGSRDAWDRFMMEKSIEKTMNLMIGLIVNKQEKPIDLTLFEGEIDRLQKAFPDQVEEFVEVFESKTVGKMKVESSMYKKENGEMGKYKFEIESGTTMKKDDQAEHTAINEIMGVISKIPGLMDQVVQTGMIRLGDKQLDFGELLQRHIITSGIQDWDKIISEVDQNDENYIDPQTEAVANQQMAQLEQMFGGGNQPMMQGNPMQGGMNG